MLKRKNRIFQKVTAMTAAVAMSLSVASVGYAATYTQSTYEQPTVIDVFNTFDSFETSASASEFFAPANVRTGGTNLALQDDDQGGKVVKFNGSSWVDYVFDETIKTGVLHLGFDYKATSDGGLYVRGFSNRRRPDNTNFTWNWNTNNEGEDTEIWLSSLNIGAANSDGEVTYPQNLGEANAPSKNNADNTHEVLDTEWHRYDIYMYFNVSANTGTYYFKDGELKKKGLATDGLKSIGFQGGTVGALMDNIVVEHYPTVKEGLTAEEENGYYKTAQAKMNAVFTTDSTGTNAGTLSVAFSEPVESFTSSEILMDDADFTITDALGEIVEGAIKTGEYKDGGVALTLDSKVTPGVYTLSVSEGYETYYTGKISSTMPQSVKFIVTSSNTIKADTVRSYMNEDFEDYSGGMPNGFVRTSDLSYNGTYGATSSTDATYGKGLKLNNEDVVYKFPEAIKDGNFTIEFDVNAEINDEWFVALPLAHIFESDEWTQAKGWTDPFDGGSITWEDGIKRDVGYLVGNADGGVAITYSETKSTTYKTATTPDESPVPARLAGCDLNDGWTNVKIDVDLNDGKAYVTTKGNAESRQAITFDASRFTSELLGKKPAAGSSESIIGKTLNDRKIMPGIGGLRLVSKSGDVVYDNVKVYSNASYNAANDFNTWSSERTFKHTGWPQIDNEIAPIRTTTGYTYQKTDGSTGEEKGNKYGSYVSYGDKAGNELAGNEFDTFIGAVDRADNDKSLKIIGQSNQLNSGYRINSHGINYYFNVPVKAGKAFDIDMDLYLPAENNAFSVGLFTSANEFGAKSGITSQGTFSAGATNALSNTVLYNLHQGSGKTTTDGTFYMCSGTRQPYDDAVRATPKNGEEQLKLNVFSDVSGAENDGWTKIKFSYIPKSDGVYFKVTVGEGAAAKESQEYKSGMSAANDVLGIQFNHGIAPTTNGSYSSFNVDNIKVMEKGDVVNNSVSDVYMIKVDGTAESIEGNTVSTDNDAIEIKTSKALVSLDGARFFLNKTDVSGKKIEVTANLSEDKSSILIPITEQMINFSAEGDLKLTAQLPSTIKSADSYLGFFEPQTLNYNIEEADGKVVINEFRIYRYIPDSTWNKKVDNVVTQETVKGGWYPVSGELKDLPTDTEYKLVAKGNNTGEETTVTLLWATQNEDNLITADKSVVIAPKKGSFTVESDVFTLETAPQTFKAVLWEDMKPLKQMIKLNKKAEPTT